MLDSCLGICYNSDLVSQKQHTFFPHSPGSYKSQMDLHGLQSRYTRTDFFWRFLARSQFLTFLAVRSCLRSLPVVQPGITSVQSLIEHQFSNTIESFDQLLPVSFLLSLVKVQFMNLLASVKSLLSYKITYPQAARNQRWTS